MTTDLFGQLDLDAAPPPAPAHTGPVAVVALEQAVDRVLDYAVPEKLASHVRVGQRVKVPLGRGNTGADGFVVGVKDRSDHPKLKALKEITDERVLVTPPLMELARWIARYYVAPLGVVLDSVIPGAVKKRIGLEYTPMVRLAVSPEQIQGMLEQNKSPKRRAALARLLQIQPDTWAPLHVVAGEAGVKPATIRKLTQTGLITIRLEPDLGGLAANEPSAADEVPLDLNPDQQRVYDELRPRLTQGFSVNLIHGITGSGKTEVYLHCISEVVKAGKQAVVLVPEIALTPQTVRRFTRRFERVAVLHSGLSQSQRHKFWQQIATGGAQVVVGARSAVFAPVPNPGILVVDEEHESSYKQDTAPRYHARDVAIKRAQLEQVPVILGSATPSLETWWRVGGGAVAPTAGAVRPAYGHTPAPATPGEGGGEGVRESSSRSDADSPHPNPPNPLPPDRERGPGGSPRAATSSLYHLLSLPNRANKKPLPHVEVIDLREAARQRRGVHLISMRLEHLLKHTLEQKQQAILLLNRRGYSNFVYCGSCGEAVQCKYCDATMTYHRTAGEKVLTAQIEPALHAGQLHCHYCLAVNPLPAACPTCGKKLSLFGLGTQRVEEEIERKFPTMKYARVDSDTMRSGKDYEETLAAFGRGEIEVLLGTQMIAKGLDFPNVTLVGVISGDTALSLPDFRAGERTFQLITQVAGRAGRGEKVGRVVVQTFQPDDDTIRDAVTHDYLAFAAREMAHRVQVQLPPVARMARVVLRDEDEAKLAARGDDLGAALSDAIAAGALPVAMKGPMPCPIARIAGYHRMQIVLSSPKAGAIQQALATLRGKGDLAAADRVAVDVDPVSLL